MKLKYSNSVSDPLLTQFPVVFADVLNHFHMPIELPLPRKFDQILILLIMVDHQLINALLSSTFS